jgi:hypothetical protein
MSPVSSPVSHKSPVSANCRLPHWSEVSSESVRPLPSLNTAAVLHDLVTWAADLACVLTRGCPHEIAAIERVRAFACDWLAGAPCSSVAIDDVLTTMAALLAGFDRDLGGTVPDDDESDAVGAAVGA